MFRLLAAPVFLLLIASQSVADEEFLRLSTKVALDPDNSDLGTLHDRRNMPRLRYWIDDMGRRMLRIVPQDSVMRNKAMRDEFLAAAYYESLRAGLDPAWVLAVIEVESAFRKYAVSEKGARGYMQVMPFWVGIIGEDHHNLFHLRTNLRYGTVILRHYLDIEGGDMYRALGRYNGSLGRPQYPNLVLAALRENWLRGA